MNWEKLQEIRLLKIFLLIIQNFSNLLSLVLGALAPVIAGLLIAFLLNILMCFYEKHFFPKNKKKAIYKWYKQTNRFIEMVDSL